jgi:beta-glucanase (GH16 family)
MSKRHTRATAALATLATVALGFTTNLPSQAVARAAAPATGTTSLMPPLVQPGVRPAQARAASVVGVVRFSPAKRGRQVVIQRRLPGGIWRTVTVKRQSAAGTVTFVAASARGYDAYAYRGVARRAPGLPTVRASGVSTASWRLRFSDEFGGTSLDLSRWSYRALGQTTTRRTRSVSAKDAVVVRDGILRLLVKKSPAGPNRFLNGHIATQGKFSFTRGVAAARIRFERGKGQHGAFWMQPTVARKVPGDPRASGAEVDVAEYFGAGYRNGGLGSFLYNYGILDDEGKPRRMGAVFPQATAMLPGRDDWWKSYHVFSVEWTPTSYIFRVDGRRHWRTSAGVSGVSEFLILSLLTSDYELPRLSRNSLPSRMYVDWARVWQR